MTAAIPITSTISAAPGNSRQKDPLRGRWHERRRLGIGARLLHDDRRRDEAVQRLDPIFPTLAPGVRRHPAPWAARSWEAPLKKAICTAAPGAGHFVKMVHNGIEYGIMAAYAEGLERAHARQRRQAARETDAETTPMRDPEQYQYDLTCARSPKCGGAAA